MHFVQFLTQFLTHFKQSNVNECQSPMSCIADGGQVYCISQSLLLLSQSLANPVIVLHYSTLMIYATQRYLINVSV